jgi:hypothetical protein
VLKNPTKEPSQRELVKDSLGRNPAFGLEPKFAVCPEDIAFANQVFNKILKSVKHD